MGSDVIVVDPPRKGLDPSLLVALQSVSFMKIKHNLSDRWGYDGNLGSFIVISTFKPCEIRSFLFIRLTLTYYSSSEKKVKIEKRPWILRERETSVHGQVAQDESPSVPQTLIYISCGWDSFKEVVSIF